MEKTTASESTRPTQLPFRLAAGTAADATELAQLDRSLWGEWANPITLYRQLVDIYPDATLVARDAYGNLVGWAVGLSNGYTRQGWVLSVDVHPQWRGRGVGKALLQKLLAGFRASMIQQVAAVIAPDNTPSQRLFKSLGFRLTRLEPGYFGPDKTHQRWTFAFPQPLV